MRAMSADQTQTVFEQALTAWKNNQFDNAKVLADEVVRRAPDHAEALHLLGLLAQRAGHGQQALDLVGDAIKLKPDNAVFHASRADALQSLGRSAPAVAGYDTAIALNPAYVEAHINRGHALNALGQTDAAIASYRTGVQLRPADPKLHAIFATVLLKHERWAEAEEHLRSAITLSPENARLHNRLGTLLQERSRWIEAEACFRQALALNPADAEAHYKLGSLFEVQGRVVESEHHYRQSSILRPNDAITHSSLIGILDMTPAATTASMQGERRGWADRFATWKTDALSFANPPRPHRRLKIGYVSADFRDHSAAVVFGAMLLKFDSSQFDVFAYSNTLKADRVTELFKRHATRWREIAGMSDDDVARMIKADGIDILVDLSGHSGGNRLLVFARKPAPIQVTAWGYITGTGMTAVDAIFADPVVIPEEEKQFYAEEVVYLPNVVCTAFQLTQYPDVNPLPAASGSGVTFGSFNRLSKISELPLKAWARVLAAVPGSRMVIKAPGLENAHLRESIQRHFTDAGVDPVRITFMGRTRWREHMSAFHQVDLVLDAFPHSGGVTTLDALSMGVPVVTLKWPTLVGRLSASFLTAVGLTDWIAETEDEFVARAVEKANDVEQLKALRQTLRSRLADSVIGDTRAYVAAVEHEYRRLWQRWCAAQV